MQKLLLFIFVTILSCKNLKQDSHEIAIRLSIFDNPSQPTQAILQANKEVFDNENYDAAQLICTNELKKLQIQGNKKGEIDCLIDYFLILDLYTFDKSKDLAVFAEKILQEENDENTRWNLCYVLSNYYIEIKDIESSLKHAGNLAEIAGKSHRTDLLSLANLIKAKALEIKKSDIEVINSYLNALLNAKKSNNTKVLIKVNDEISKFYYKYNVFDKALKYKTDEIQLRTFNNFNDSI
jgi:hypothetical protein